MRLRLPPHPNRLAEDRSTAPFWEAARERRLVVCECATCHALRMPPGPFCPNCQSQSVQWRGVPGTGSVYSYTIVRRALTPESAKGIPYAPAVIALDDAPGIRLVSAVVGCAPEKVGIDARVRPLWHALPDGHVVAYFTLDESAESVLARRK